MSDAPAELWVPFYQALKAQAGFEVVGESVTKSQLRITGRVPKPGMRVWLDVVETLLLPIQGSTCGIDISKQYFVRADGLRFAWRIIIQGEEVASNVELLKSTALSITSKTQGAAVHRVMEMPLIGVGSNRNDAKANKGKGAQPNLKSVVGRDQKARMSNG